MKFLNKNVLKVAKVILLLTPLVWLLLGVKWVEISRLLAGLPLWVVPVVLILFLAKSFIQSFRFRHLLRPFQVKIDVFKMYSYDMKARYYSIIIPTSVGQDIARGALLSKYMSPEDIVSTSIFFRITGMLPLLMMAALGFLNLSARSEFKQLAPALLGGALAFAASVTILMSARCTKGIASRMEGFAPQKLTHFFSAVTSGLQFYRQHRGLVAHNLILSLISQLLIVLISLLAIYGITQEWYLFEVFAMVPLIEIAAILIPFTPNGAGTREAMYLLLFSLLHRSREEMLVLISIIALGQIVNFGGGLFVAHDWLTRKNEHEPAGP